MLYFYALMHLLCSFCVLHFVWDDIKRIEFTYLYKDECKDDRLRAVASLLAFIFSPIALILVWVGLGFHYGHRTRETKYNQTIAKLDRFAAEHAGVDVSQFRRCNPTRVSIDLNSIDGVNWDSSIRHAMGRLSLKEIKLIAASEDRFSSYRDIVSMANDELFERIVLK